jgi:hypothetical protein
LPGSKAEQKHSKRQAGRAFHRCDSVVAASDKSTA